MLRVVVFIMGVLMGITLVSGCGGPAGLYPVTGQVNFKGEPAEGAKVSFFRKDGLPTGPEIPQARVEADGSFALVSPDRGPGAAPGEYAVLVEWRQGPLRTHRKETARTVGKKAAREGKPLLIADDRLNGRYSRIDQPRLVAQVKPERNSLPPFDLSD